MNGTRMHSCEPIAASTAIAAQHDSDHALTLIPDELSRAVNTGHFGVVISVAQASVPKAITRLQALLED